MTAHLWDTRLTYVSVPKCGSTSLKWIFFELTRGVPFDDQSAPVGIHKLFPSRPFWRLPHRRIRSHAKYAVVRDPVSRFLSGYYGKVVREGCLKRDLPRRVLQALRLSVEPSMDEFLRRLRLYMVASPVVLTHFQRLSYFLGRNPRWFTQIFDVSELGRFGTVLQGATGHRVALPHVNPSEGPRHRAEVPDRLRAAIAQHYREDIALYGHAFRTPA